MPPPGHDLLLAAIRDDPDDDTLRLAYADWLDEHGDAERAEFVRVQCRLAALGHGPLWPHAGLKEASALAGRLSDEQAGLVLRQAELWELNRDGWLAELPELSHCTVLFHRGFAAEVVVSENPGALVRNGARLFPAAPVTRVVFRDCTPDAVELGLLSPWFDTIRGLTVGWHRPPAGAGNRVAEVVAGAPYLAGLRDLSLFGVAMANPGAHDVAAAPFARRLVRLDLAQNEIRDSGAMAIARAIDPARLRVLDLTGNPLTDIMRNTLRRRFGDRACVEGEEE